MHVAGHRIFITYEGQKMTCYVCNTRGHVAQECPHKRTSHPTVSSPSPKTWTSIIHTGTEQRNAPTLNDESTSPAPQHEDPVNNTVPSPPPIPTTGIQIRMTVETTQDGHVQQSTSPPSSDSTIASQITPPEQQDAVRENDTVETSTNSNYTEALWAEM
jgi:hypothetical protein